MLKMISIILIFLLCSLLGFMYSEKFKKRYCQLKDVYKIVTILQNKVVLSSTALPEAFQEVAANVKEPFNKVLYDVSTDLNKCIDSDIYSCFRRVYEGFEDEFNLKKDDVGIISDFIKSLGECGVYGQDKIFILCLESLRLNIDEAFDECNKNTRLYKYLGVCIGAMISILLL